MRDYHQEKAGHKGAVTENMSTADKRLECEAIQMAFPLCLALVVFAASRFEFHPSSNRLRLLICCCKLSSHDGPLRLPDLEC